MKTNTVLALIDGSVLRDDVDRVAAAAGLSVVHAERPSGRTAWLGAHTVVLDISAARRCAPQGMPRRDGVLLVGRADPGAEEWRAAVDVGARQCLRLPEQDGQFVELLTTGFEHGPDVSAGSVLAVLGGCGGAGASLFSVALAQTADPALLVDADPWGGGIDLAMGTEAVPGLRWSDLVVREGSLSYDALRSALPHRRNVTVLSGGRAAAEIEPGPLAAVVAAARRAGVTVVCDTPRRRAAVTECALGDADLVIMVVPADVRAAAAAGAFAGWARSVNPNIGLVVRGPSPGGLRAEDLAAGIGLPLLAAMRPQPGVAAALERGGLRCRPRSPLGGAAARVLRCVRGQP